MAVPNDEFVQEARATVATAAIVMVMVLIIDSVFVFHGAGDGTIGGQFLFPEEMISV